MELITRYGWIDILWLDAGWVKGSDHVKQDIRLGEVVERARQRLMDFVTKDGNWALKLCPQPDGRLPARAADERYRYQGTLASRSARTERRRPWLQ